MSERRRVTLRVCVETDLELSDPALTRLHEATIAAALDVGLLVVATGIGLDEMPKPKGKQWGW
jgi:hypothetical protein